MKQFTSSLVFIALAFFFLLGCGESSSNNTSKVTNPGPADEIDEDGQFELILKEIDKVVGKRFQSMQMGAMSSVTYQFSGAIDKVTSIVDPLAKNAGYLPMDSDKSQEAIEEGQKQAQQMTNMNMKMVGTKMYQHENGNLITISRMDVSSDAPNMQVDMKMLTVQMMNPAKMSEIGSAGVK